jgi:transposase
MSKRGSGKRGVGQATNTGGVPAPRVRRAERLQVQFRLASLDQLVSEDHPVRGVWEFAEQVDLTALYSEIRAVEGAPGHPATDPRILFALWLYATLDGIGSARRLADLCLEHQAYQWMCGGVSVNHHTLSDFRVQQVDLLDRLLADGVAGLVSQKLVSLNRVAQDGVRVRASAGAASFRREPTLREHLAEAEEQVRVLRQELEENPGASSKREAASRDRAAHERRDRVKAALEELSRVRESKRTDEERENARGSETDPEARVMKMADGGYRPAFNVQFATDVGSGIIVGVDVGNVGSDKGQITPMLEQLVSRFQRTPTAYLVDGDFVAHEEIEKAFCDFGCRVYAPVKAPRDSGRDPHEPLESDTPGVAEWRRRMGTTGAKALYKLRGQIAEWVIAIARNRGLQRFLVRGIRKVKSVALWFALAHNFTRRLAIVT